MNIQNFMIKNLVMDIENQKLNRQKFYLIFNSQYGLNFFEKFLVWSEENIFNEFLFDCLVFSFLQTLLLATLSPGSIK